MLGWWILVSIVLLFGVVVLRGAPYVPSRRRYIKEAFEVLYPLGSKDVLVDVGSGDGIVLRVASEKGARAVGIELNPVLVLLSRWLSRRDSRVSVLLGDFWLRPLPDDTTVVYTFIASAYIVKLEKRIQHEADRLRRPLYLVLHGNELAGREPTAEVEAYRLYEFIPLQMTKA